MSSRFHNKYHRHNHHTYRRINEPDAGHDPIASPLDPFLGDFTIQGAISAVAPLSASAGFFTSNFVGVSAIGGTTGAWLIGPNGARTISTAVAEDPSALNQAGLYTFAQALSTGPFPTVDYVRGLWPKALVVDGYSDFRWPLFATQLYAYDFHCNTFAASSLNVPYVSAGSAEIGSLTAYNTTVINATSTDVFVTEMSAATLSANYIEVNNLDNLIHGCIGLRQSASSTISQSTWTLVPLVSAKWDTRNWFTTAGTIKPKERGLYFCEMNVTTHPVSGTPLAIITGITTNTLATSLTANMDNLSNIFIGNWFTNNGVSYTDSQGITGVMFTGSTLVAADGVNDEIGVYLYNSNGQSIVDYARLRVVRMGVLS